jgi:hypothetical protein
VSKESVNNTIDAIGYSKVYACWVPRSLTDYHKTVWKEVCSYLLSHYKADGKSFCHSSSLGMKHGSITFNRRQKVQCHHPASQKNKFKATPSAGKVMATDFLGCRMDDSGRRAMWSNH